LRRNKFGAKKTSYNGVLYDSKLEAAVALELDMLKRARKVERWQRQVTVDLRGMGGTLICRHKVDFFVTFRDGHQEYWEAKGVRTAVWRIKYKLFTDNFPKLKYVVRTKA
jgi:hypothetical protein